MSLAERVRKAPHVYLIGNGGSYANAIHICNDLIACGIRACTLDPATLTAIANDHGYEYIFSRWLETVGRKGDLLIALSGSGTSKNILMAIRIATLMGMDVEKVFGAPGLDMESAEEYQIVLGHQLKRDLKK
jgi:D-sedoheptulose 7-phosphate isomerase